MARLPQQDENRVRSDITAIAKYKRQRAEAKYIIDHQEEVAKEIRAEIRKRENAIQELKRRLANLPVEVEAARRKVASCNLQITSIRHHKDTITERARLRRQRADAKAQLRAIEKELSGLE